MFSNLKFVIVLFLAFICSSAHSQGDSQNEATQVQTLIDCESLEADSNQKVCTIYNEGLIVNQIQVVDKIQVTNSEDEADRLAKEGKTSIVIYDDFLKPLLSRFSFGVGFRSHSMEIDGYWYDEHQQHSMKMVSPMTKIAFEFKPSSFAILNRFRVFNNRFVRPLSLNIAKMDLGRFDSSAIADNSDANYFACKAGGPTCRAPVLWLWNTQSHKTGTAYTVGYEHGPLKFSAGFLKYSETASFQVYDPYHDNKLVAHGSNIPLDLSAPMVSAEYSKGRFSYEVGAIRTHSDKRYYTTDYHGPETATTYYGLVDFRLYKE